jgi:hypothetical protein
MFGKGGKWSEFPGNILADQRKCRVWAALMNNALQPLDKEAKAAGWHMQVHWNALMAGDLIFGTFAFHNFLSITFDPSFFEAPNLPHPDLNPDFLLDPWPNARPDIYDYKDAKAMWPVTTASTGDLAPGAVPF